MEAPLSDVTPMRPLPEPGELTRPFWEGAARGALLHPRCDDCGQAFFPPHVVCQKCRSAGWSWVESAGRGTVYSFTVVHRAPQPGFDPPYVLAVVDLDERLELMTNLVGVSPDDVRIGQRVRVEWRSFGDITLPMFTPDEEAPR